MDICQTILFSFSTNRLLNTRKEPHSSSWPLVQQLSQQRSRLLAGLLGNSLFPENKADRLVWGNQPYLSVGFAFGYLGVLFWGESFCLVFRFSTMSARDKVQECRISHRQLEDSGSYSFTTDQK